MWYYAEGSNRKGPFQASDIERLIADNTVTGDTLVWREGLDGWEAASNHFTIGAGAPPPIPDAGAAPDPAASPQQTYSAPTGDQIGADGLYVGAPSRTFGEAISTCFSKFVTFKGRASRSEYWFFILFTALLGIGASILDALLFPGQIDVAPINSIVTLAVFLPTLSASVRRLHDTDRSGWWIGGLYLILLGFGVVVGVIIAGEADNSFAAGPPDSMVALLGLGGIVFFVYAIVLLVFHCTKGTLGPNRFG